MKLLQSTSFLQIVPPPWDMKGNQGKFPVFYSLLAPEALMSLVLPYYELGRVNSCQFWHRGLSDIYLVNIEDIPYILRVSHHHWRSEPEIIFELELLDFLQQRQIPVAYPLKTRQGKLFFDIDAPEGKRYAALFPYAPGAVALGDLNVTQSRLLGETLAKLHQASQGFTSTAQRQPLNLDYLLDDSLAAIAPFLAGRRPELAELLETAEQIKCQLQQLPSEPPYWGICWGDPHSGNVHFTTDLRMTLFDFDQCGYGWRSFDIAKFGQVSLQTGLSCKVRTAFVAGYQAIAELTSWEIDCLPALTQAAHIWAWAISLSTAKNYNYSRLDGHYFRQRLEQLKCLKSHDCPMF
jgi:Ser/Thr protein kinase RdoA (MazF antagonist)